MLALPLVGFAHVEEQGAGVDEGVRRAGADLGRSTDVDGSVARRSRQPCALPRAVPAEQIGDVDEPSIGEHAGGDEGAVAAGAVDDHRALRIETSERVGEHRKGDLTCAGQRACPRSPPGCARRPAGGPGSSPRNSASCSIVRRELLSIRSDGGERRRRVVELPDDPVVPDACQADLGFDGGRRVTDEHDVAVGCQHIAGPFGEATLEPDVHAPRRCPAAKSAGSRASSSTAPAARRRDDLVDREQRRRLLVEQRAQLPVALSIELEVVRLQRLSLGDQRDERVLVHRLQCVVGATLLTDASSSSHSKSACRTTTRRRAPGRRGWRRAGTATACRAGSDRAGAASTSADNSAPVVAKQVGPSDITDEQRVAGEHAVRNSVVGVLVHDDADRLRRVAGGGKDLERDIAQREPLTVDQGSRSGTRRRRRLRRR